jgi:dihydrofolate synthase/folylpolyglutamate synthase
VAALLETVAELGHVGPRLLVFGTSADKDAETMLAQLLPQFDHVVLTRYVSNPRGVDPHQLYARARGMRQTHGWSRATLHHQADPASAWRLVETLISPAHLVCVTGSFFLAAEMRTCIDQPRLTATSCS